MENGNTVNCYEIRVNVGIRERWKKSSLIEGKQVEAGKLLLRGKRKSKRSRKKTEKCRGKFNF